MTLADAQTGLDEQGEVTEPIPPEAEPAHAPRSGSRSGWKRPVAIVLVTVLVVALVVALFAGPIERVWYRARQHHLAADLNEPRRGVAPGQALCVLQVPRLGINVVVVEGDTPELLRGAPGHRVDTARPGARGNTLIVGHRRAWGGPFSAIDRIRPGDLIAMQTRQKKTIVYRVRSVQRVGASSSRLLGRSRDHRLTLVTGRGGTFSNDRLVVTAVSGPAARHASLPGTARATTPGESVILNPHLLLAVVAFALAAGAIFYLRRRVGTLTMAVVVVPLVAAGALSLLLDLSLLLPPLA